MNKIPNFQNVVADSINKFEFTVEGNVVSLDKAVYGDIAAYGTPLNASSLSEIYKGLIPTLTATYIAGSPEKYQITINGLFEGINYGDTTGTGTETIIPPVGLSDSIKFRVYASTSNTGTNPKLEIVDGATINSYQIDKTVNGVKGGLFTGDVRANEFMELQYNSVTQHFEYVNHVIKTIVNNTLTSTSVTEALSANMGKQLQDNKENVGVCYPKAESDARYEPIDSAYTKSESDGRYSIKNYGSPSMSTNHTWTLTGNITSTYTLRSDALNINYGINNNGTTETFGGLGIHSRTATDAMSVYSEADFLGYCSCTDTTFSVPNRGTAGTSVGTVRQQVPNATLLNFYTKIENSELQFTDSGRPNHRDIGWTQVTEEEWERLNRLNSQQLIYVTPANEIMELSKPKTYAEDRMWYVYAPMVNVWDIDPVKSKQLCYNALKRKAKELIEAQAMLLDITQLEAERDALKSEYDSWVV